MANTYPDCSQMMVLSQNLLPRSIQRFYKYKISKGYIFLMNYLIFLKCLIEQSIECLQIIYIIMKIPFTLLIIVLLSITAQSVKVFDLAGTFKGFQCMKDLGFELSIIRAYHSYGAIDVTAPANIQLSNQIGLATDVYMFPCRGKNAATQVNQLVDYLDSMMKIQGQKSYYEYQVGTIWLDIQTNPSSGCTWNIGTPESNCAYVGELIKAVEARGRSVGIYASGYMWNQIMGNRDSCTSYSSYPLWYPHYDGKDSFDDWSVSKFGGWTVPTIKQYAGDAVACGIALDLSFY